MFSFFNKNSKTHFESIFFLLNLTKTLFSSLQGQETKLPVIFSHLLFKMPQTIVSLTFFSQGISLDWSRTYVEFWSDCEMIAYFSGVHFRLTLEPKLQHGYYPTFVLKSNSMCSVPWNHPKPTIPLFCTTINKMYETI